jgi:hypothetical protein
MKNRLLLAALAFMITIALASKPAGAFTEAGEAYVNPTFAELTQTTILLGGMDVNSPGVLDEYIKLMYCQLYKDNYSNDFAWHEIQKQILSRINSKKEYYRSLFQLGGVIILGQYDFKNKQFPLEKYTAFQNVGYMGLFSVSDFKPYCQMFDDTKNVIPTGESVFSKQINIVLSEPFNMTGLKVTPEQAQKILDMFTKLRTTDRKLYIRFRFRVQSVANASKQGNFYVKTDLSGEIVSIDLFYDKEMTKWYMNLPLR